MILLFIGVVSYCGEDIMVVRVGMVVVVCGGRAAGRSTDALLRERGASVGSVFCGRI